MPARVHALLVVRPDGRGPADLHLSRTLAALAAQSRPVDRLTVVLCGGDERLRQLAAESGAEGVIVAGRGTGFAEALRMATHRLDGDAVWLLAQDTAPAPRALARLAGALETAPSVAFAAPKLVRWDDAGVIVSLGVTMTRTGRAIGLADAELDQGQHDGGEDVLGADVRGVLVRADAWRRLEGIDPALAGADEGLDLGVRARLSGGRVALAPTALVAVAGDGVAGTPDDRSMLTRGRRMYAERTAQLHRRLVYAPAPAVLLHWLSLLPLALGRTLGHLLAKRPGRIGPEWGAALTVLLRPGAIARARSRIRRTRSASWAQLAPLRVTQREMRQRFDGVADPAVGEGRADLRFFSGGGAWTVLGMLVLSVAAFPALLTWPVLAGEALAPLRSTVGRLWADAAYGQRPLGWDTVAPADPFSAIVALWGSLSPWEPSRAVVVVWLLALPLAALGGWFAATRVTERSSLRATGALAWALAPTFLAALVEGRPTGVLVHLLLPWLLYTAVSAHRSWTSAGVASLLLAAVLACAPSLGPAAIGIWLVGLVLALVLRRGRGIGRLAWLIVPTAVVFTPIVWHQLRAGNPWAVLADPGVVAAATDPVTPDIAGRMLLALGFPTGDPGGWSAFLTEGTPVWWVLLLTAPVIVLALLAPLTARVVPAAVMLLIAAAGIITAFLAVGVSLSVAGAAVVPLWPGSALSLAWAGLVAAALLTLTLLRGISPVRVAAATLVVTALAVSAVPALTATARGTAGISSGSVSTLPAYVEVEGRTGVEVGTLVLSPLPDGSVAAAVVWGGSATLGGQSTAQATRTDVAPADTELARVAVDLLTGAAGDVVDDLSAHGIAYVLLDPGIDEQSAARSMRLLAETTLDQRDALERVGNTPKGSLWRILGEADQRTVSSAHAATAARIAAAALGVVLVALLLAIPTRASLDEAQRLPRVVGAGRRERR